MRPIANLTDDVASAALAAAGWWARLGHVPHFPGTLAQAAHILRVGGEYDVDETHLDELIDRGIVSAPDDGLWGEADIVQAGAILEARRQWANSPSLHDEKKTAQQLTLETARVSDTVGELLETPIRLDLRHMLILLAEADNRIVREKLLVQALATLEGDHGIRC